MTEDFGAQINKELSFRYMVLSSTLLFRLSSIVNVVSCGLYTRLGHQSSGLGMSEMLNLNSEGDSLKPCAVKITPLKNVLACLPVR